MHSNHYLQLLWTCRANMIPSSFKMHRRHTWHIWNCCPNHPQASERIRRSVSIYCNYRSQSVKPHKVNHLSRVGYSEVCRLRVKGSESKSPYVPKSVKEGRQRRSGLSRILPFKNPLTNLQTAIRLNLKLFESSQDQFHQSILSIWHNGLEKIGTRLCWRREFRNWQLPHEVASLGIAKKKKKSVFPHFNGTACRVAIHSLHLQYDLLSSHEKGRNNRCHFTRNASSTVLINVLYIDTALYLMYSHLMYLNLTISVVVYPKGFWWGWGQGS